MLVVMVVVNVMIMVVVVVVVVVIGVVLVDGIGGCSSGGSNMLVVEAVK